MSGLVVIVLEASCADLRVGVADPKNRKII